MIRPTGASLVARIAAAVVCLTCASLLAAAVAGAATIVVYQKESLPTYETQLAGGQVQAVTINKRIRSLRVTLKSGAHVLVKYPPHHEPTYAAALQAKGVPTTVLKPAEAIKEVVKKPVHHKLRYIAAGILILVIVIVGVVLYVDRKRKRAIESGSAA
jgi:hypothetical protein